MAQGRKRGRPRKVDAAPTSDDLRTTWERWDAKVRQARTIRKDWMTRYKVTTGEDFYEGQQWSGQESGLVFNHFFATIKTILPNLIFRNPMFYVRAKPGQGRQAERDSQIGEATLTAIGDQDGHLAQAAKLGVLQSLFRIGVLKVCYDNTMEPNPRKGMPIWATDMNGKGVVGPDGAPQQAIDPTTGQPMTEPDQVMSDESYRYRWVDARHMLLPDEGPDQDQWTWIGEEITVPLEEARQDERFPRDKRLLLTSNVSRDDGTKTGYSRRGKAESDQDTDPLFCYVECYDFKEKRVYRWAEGQLFEREFLSDDPLPDGIEEHPYAILSYNPIQGERPSPWPIPVVYPWVEVQTQYNIKRQQVTEGGKRAARKLAITPDMFPDDEQAKKALTSPNDMETFTVVDLQRIPVPMDAPPLSADLYKDLQLLQYDWTVITGATGARLSNPTGETATEAMFTERAANLRDADLQGTVASWLTVAGKKMWQLVRQTLTLEMYVKIRGFDDDQFKSYVQELTGKSIDQLMMMPGMKESLRQRYGKETWLQVSRDELQFEADISIVPGSQRPQTLDAERRVAFEFLTLLGQNPQLAMSKMLLQWIAGKFDPPIPPAVVEEVHLLAQKMVEINANQAGRNQGANTGTQNGGGANGASPIATLAPLLQTAMAGGMG